MCFNSFEAFISFLALRFHAAVTPWFYLSLYFPLHFSIVFGLRKSGCYKYIAIFLLRIETSFTIASK